ncbi:MAG TPA: hypothetical protein VMV18_11890, partial [bacterium]|nr:hypothetical protein [bacterium]
LLFPVAALALPLTLSACGGRPATGEYAGLVTVVRSNANGQIGFSATAMWLKTPFRYDADAILRADGHCVPIDPAAERLSTVTLDAGNYLGLTVPGGSSMNMDPLTSDIRLYGAAGSPDLFVPDAEYSISGVGGKDVGAFDLKVETSGDMRLLSPPVDGTATISHAAGVELHWTSAGTKDPVLFEIDQTSMTTGATVSGVRCSLPDSGLATIAPADIASLALSSSSPQLVTRFSLTKVALSEESIAGAGLTLIQSASRAEGMISVVE